MRKTFFIIFSACVLSACSSGAIGTEPSVTVVNPAKAGVLQFAVGTARIGYNTNPSGDPPPPPSYYVGLNTVATYRQADGTTATLYNVPTITAPAGLVDPVTLVAAGTERIDASQLNTLSPGSAAATILGGYGLCACGSNATTVTGNQSLFVPPSLPVESSVFSLGTPQFAGGPPAFPRTTGGGYPADFVGYSLGFTDFEYAPTSGSYTMQLAFPPTFLPSVNATATLNANAVLPPFPPPAFTPDGTGGGTIVLDVPSGVTETLAILQVINDSFSAGASGNCGIAGYDAPYYFTVSVTGSGTQNVFLPDDLGPTISGVTVPTLCAEAEYSLVAVGFDYGALQAAYPFSTSQTPSITGNDGQADITVSEPVYGFYETTSSTAVGRQRKRP